MYSRTRFAPGIKLFKAGPVHEKFHGGYFGPWSACYFPFVGFSLVLCLTLFTRSGVSVNCYLFLFASTFFFNCWPPRLPAGGVHDRFCFIQFSSFFIFLCRFVFFLFVFSFRFCISENVYAMPVVSIIMTWHFITHHCCNTWYLVPGTWQRSISVA